MKQSIFKLFGIVVLILLITSSFLGTATLLIVSNREISSNSLSENEPISPNDVDILYNPTLNGEWYPHDNNTIPYFQNYENKYQKVWEPWLTKAAVHTIAVSEDGEFMAIAGGYLYDTSLHIYRYNPDVADYVHVWDVGSDIIKGDVMALAFGDTDNNRFMEIIAASTDGRLYVFEQRHVYDPYTRTENQFELVWKSKRMNRVFSLEIYDADKDGRDDIIAAAWDNKIHVFEYIDHSGYPFSTEHWIKYTEVWNSDDTIDGKLTALTTGDTNYNGLPEIIIGTYDGRIYVFENNGTVLYVEDGTPFPLPNDNEYKLIWNSSGTIWNQILDMTTGNFDTDPFDEVAIVAQDQGVYVLDDYDNVTNTYDLHKLLMPLLSWEKGTGSFYAGHPLDHYIDDMVNATNVFYFENDTTYEEPINYTYLGGGKVEPNISIIPFNSAMVGPPDTNCSWFNASSSYHPGVNATAILDFGNDEEATGNANDDPDIEILFRVQTGFMSSPNLTNLHIYISKDGETFYEVSTSDITYETKTDNFTVYLNIDNILSENHLYYIRYLQINATDPTEKYAIDSITTYYLYRPIDNALSVASVNLFDSDTIILEMFAYTYYNQYGKSVDYWMDYFGVNNRPEKIVIGTVDGRLLVFYYNGTDYTLLWESYEEERFGLDTNIWDIEEVRTTSVFPTWLGSFSSINGTPISLPSGIEYSMHMFYDLEDTNDYLEMIISTQNGTIYIYRPSVSGTYIYDTTLSNEFFYYLENYYSSDQILTFTLADLTDEDYPEIVICHFNKSVTPSGNLAEDSFTPADAGIDVWRWTSTVDNYTAPPTNFVNLDISETIEEVLKLSQIPPTVYFADYDGDGDLDMVVSNGLLYLYENIGSESSDYGRFKLVPGYFKGINRRSMGRSFSHPLLVNFDSDQDYDLMVGFDNKLGMTYFENIGTAKNPEWIEKMSAVTNMDPDTNLGMINFTKPTLFTTLPTSLTAYENLFGTLTCLTGYNNYTQNIVFFYGDIKHHNALMLATYPTVYRYDLSLIKGESSTDFTNFGAHIVKTWDNQENLKNWTITVSTGNLDNDTKNEVIVGDYDNNLYVFEHLGNNTYKRAFKSPDITYDIITDYSPYAWEELEGLGGDFNRTIWAHVTELYTGSDINDNGLEEIVAVADLAIYVFEHEGIDDRYSLIWQYDLRYSSWGEYLLANTSAHITALTVDNDIDHNGYGEIFVAVDNVLFIFEYTPDGFREQFISTNPSEGGRYDLPGNPNYLIDFIPNIINFTIEAIYALVVADTDNDGLKELIIGGSLKELPCSDTVYGFVSILENHIGYYSSKNLYSVGNSYLYEINNPVYDIAVGDQDYDGLKELIIGHNYGITVYEYLNETDNNYVKLSSLTSSPRYPLFSPCGTFTNKDYSPFVRGQDIIELSNGTVLLFYTWNEGTANRLYVKRSSNASYYQSWTFGNRLFTDSQYPMAFTEILNETQISVVEISGGIIWLTWDVYYRYISNYIHYTLAARYAPTSGWQLFTIPTSSSLNTTISAVWEYPGTYEVGIFFMTNPGDTVKYCFGSSSGITAFSKTVPFIGPTSDKRYIATSFDAVYMPEVGNITFVFAGQFKNESKWDTDIWATTAKVSTLFDSLYGWSTPKRITSDTTYEGSLSITQMKDTDAILVVFESTDAFSHTFYASYSNDYGRSWSRPHEMPTIPAPNYLDEYCYNDELYYKIELQGQDRLVLSFKTISPVIAARQDSGFLYSMVIDGWTCPSLEIPSTKFVPLHFADIIVTFNLVSNWCYYDMGSVNSLALGDSDRDNRAEILANFENKAILFELNHVTQLYHGYTQVWTSDDFGYTVTDVAIGDGNGNGYPELVIAAEEGNVYAFETHDPKGFSELLAPKTLWREKIQPANYAYDTAVGYFKNTQSLHLAVGTDQGIYIYEAKDGTKVFSKDFGDPILRLKPIDIDYDNVDELIVLTNNGTLFCYSPSDNTIKWHFGTFSNFYNRTGFMYLENVYNPMGVSNQEELIIHIKASIVHVPSTIYVINPYTGNSIWNYTFLSNNIYSITFGNFTGESHYNIVVINGTFEKDLTIIDGDTNETIHKRDIYSGPYTFYGTLASAALDINNDGIDDLVYDNGSYILAFNATSDVLLWNVSSPIDGSCFFAKTYYADNDTIPDIALFYHTKHNSTTNNESAYFIVLSGATGVELWHSRHSNAMYCPIYGTLYRVTYHPTEPVVVDINNDGYDDIIETLFSKKYNIRAFIAYNGRNGSVIGVYLTNYTVKHISGGVYRILSGDLPKVLDIDGDQVLDIAQISENGVFNAFAFKHLGRVYKYTASQVGTLWYYKNANASRVVDITTGDVSGDGIKDVVYATEYYIYALNGKNGTLLWTANFTSRFSTANAKIRGIEAAYITDTSRMDIVLITDDARIIAIQGNSTDVADVIWENKLKHSTDYFELYDLKVAQLDDDAMNEIVVGGDYITGSDNQICVLFFKETGKEDIHYFGSSRDYVIAIDIANLTTDKYDDIIAITANGFVLAIDGTIKTSTIWVRDMGVSIRSMTISNIITSDDNDEIILGLENNILAGLRGTSGSGFLSETTRGKPIAVSVGSFFKGSSTEYIAVLTDNGTVSFYDTSGSEVLTYTTLSMINKNYLNYSTPNRMFAADYDGDTVDELILINWNYVIAMNGSSFAWAYLAPDTLITAMALDTVGVMGRQPPEFIIAGTASGRLYVASIYTTITYYMNSENNENSGITNSYKDALDFWMIFAIFGVSIIGAVVISIAMLRKKKLNKVQK